MKITDGKVVGFVIGFYILIILGVAAFWSFVGWMLYLLVTHFTSP